MKEKTCSIIIMLIGGLVASICCLVGRYTLLQTLLTVFIALVVFLAIGSIVHKVFSIIHEEVEEAARKEQQERDRKQFELDAAEAALKEAEEMGIDSEQEVDLGEYGEYNEQTEDAESQA